MLVGGLASSLMIDEGPTTTTTSSTSFADDVCSVFNGFGVASFTEAEAKEEAAALVLVVLTVDFKVDSELLFSLLRQPTYRMVPTISAPVITAAAIPPSTRFGFESHSEMHTLYCMK